VPAPALIELFVQPLESLGILYMVTGSVASMAFGEPRLTNDVDIVVELSEDDVGPVIEAYEGVGGLYVPSREVIREAIRGPGRQSFNVIHAGRALKADLFVASDALATWGLERRRREQAGEVAFWMAPPEYVIVRKLEYFRQGESAKHLDDIRSMLRYGAAGIDLGAVERLVAERGLESEWRDATRGVSGRSRTL
jgi:hypothetical protein